MSEKKQINIDQIVQQYTHLYDEGYLTNDKLAKLAKLYNKSNLLPTSMTTNLFGKDRSNHIKDLIIDMREKIQLGWIQM